MKSKPHIIKVWPEVTGYLPAIIPLRSIENDKINKIIVDFLDCTDLDSTGSLILLANIIKVVQASKSLKSSQIDAPEEVLNFLGDIGFLKHIGSYLPIQGLFQKEFKTDISKSPIAKVLSKNEIKYSYPYCFLDFKSCGQNRRNELPKFKAWLKNNLKEYDLDYDINIVQLVTILTEIAKNAADHTNDNAFFGFDIIVNNVGQFFKMTFSFVDFGIGIKDHILQNLSPEIFKKRAPKFSLVEAYFYALTLGYTSNRISGVNKGIGMSIVLDGSKAVNLSLSTFDAQSRCVLTKMDSNKSKHDEMRKHIFSVSKDTGFYYYGEILSNKLKMQ